MRLEVAAAGERGRVEVNDDRTLLQRILQREVELLARERGRGGELRRLVAFLQRGQRGQSERAGQDQPCEDHFHEDLPSSGENVGHLHSRRGFTAPQRPVAALEDAV